MRPEELQRLVQRVRMEVATRLKCRPAVLLVPMAKAAPKPPPLEAALRRAEAPVVVAGLWRRTPERWLDRDLDLETAARACDEGGAVAHAVATDPALFGAVADDFPRARKGSRKPLLRREVIVDPYQLAEARIAGASGVWLRADALPGAALGLILKAARELGLESVVEVDGDEALERSLDAGAAMVAVASEVPQAGDILHRLVTRALAAGSLPLVCVEDDAVCTAAARAGATVFVVDAPLIGADDRAQAVRDWRLGAATTS